MPIRPFRHLADALGARPGEAVAADADAIADRLAAAERQEQELVRRVDDDGAGRLTAGIIDQLLLETWIDGLRLADFRLIFRRQR
jgi:hypothetical protein